MFKKPQPPIYLLFTRAYVLGGNDSGLSDNAGIYKLLIGALIAGGLAAFLAPRLNKGGGIAPSILKANWARKNKTIP